MTTLLDVELNAGIEDAEVELEQEQEDIDQSNEAEQYGVADADAGYYGFGNAVTVIQSGTLVAADTGIDAEALADADADLEQNADQGNENTQTATPTLAFTAAPSFDRVRLRGRDAEIEAGIDDVEIEVSQEQEEIEQENEAEQDGAAYATADYAGDVYVEQSGTLTAGDLFAGIGGDGIEAASVAEAEADLDQTAIQSNINRQDITEDALPTPAFGFTADATFTNVQLLARRDAEIDAGIEDVEVELEQEQEDIDQSNEADQDGEAEAEAYAGDVYVEQSGELFAVEDGINARSDADADASLEQNAIQDNLNAQTAATTLAFDASPTFGTTTGRARATVGVVCLEGGLCLDPIGNITGSSVATDGGVALAAGDDAEIDAGIEEVEVSLEQDQEEIEQENEAEQEGYVDASAYSGYVTVITGVEAPPEPVDPTAGDTGVDAASDANAEADLEQFADQSNVNSQTATLGASFSAAATFNAVAIAAHDDAEIGAGIEDVEVEVDQDQEEIDQSNDADQYGEVYAEAYSGYVEVVQLSGGIMTAGDTGIEAESRAEAEADLDQTAYQSNENSQTATTNLSFATAPIFGTTNGNANAYTGVLQFPTADAVVNGPGGVAIAALGDAEIDAGIEDVDVEVEQEQEDIDQSNEAEQGGLYYGEDESGYWDPAYASAEASSGAVYVEQTGELFAGTVTFDPITGLPIEASGDGIDATAAADADSELQQVAVQDNKNSQDAVTDLSLEARPTFNTLAVAAGVDLRYRIGRPRC